MKKCIKLSLVFLAVILGPKALAQVGAETSEDQFKVEKAVSPMECQGILVALKKNLTAAHSDAQSDAQLNAQIYTLMSDARSQAETMNCAQNVSMAVEAVDVSQSYRAQFRRRMNAVVNAFGSAVNSNTTETLKIRTPASTIGVRG